MRNFLIMVACTTLITGCSKPKPSFTFRGIHIGLPYHEAVARHLVTKCHGSAGDEQCELTGGPIAGLGWGPINLSFSDGKLSSIDAIIAKEDFLQGGQALAKAYGEPCETRTAAIETPYGPMQVNTQAVWCFADGDLVLEKYGWGLEHSESRITFPYIEPSGPAVSGPNDL